jgi:hypothetical protein
MDRTKIVCSEILNKGKTFTPPNSEIICGQNVGTKVVCGMLLLFLNKAMLKIEKIMGAV